MILTVTIYDTHCTAPFSDGSGRIYYEPIQSFRFVFPCGCRSLFYVTLN